ncbi:unnamed protein product [Enterobius vermicularis]|uniref:Zinc finger protein 830 n=1 Tax=Enterobius vermicularis TaxID=51028 RepID=A0A0N4V7X7_ENTVE|nr:unnamed protein product [Enterobius vermicularis]
MSTDKANINPLIAKPMKDGCLLCLICNTQVKSKVWVAHSKGRKHLENIKLLKMRHAEQSSMIQTQVPQTSLGSGKRVANSLQESLPPSAKKKKEEPEEQQAETSYNGEKTPWQKTKDSGGTRSEKPVSKHTIAGVPEGFFDDEMIDSRVEETVEKQAKMEEEYAAFKKELEDAENEQEKENDVEEETFSLERDVSHIDEHIAGWKALNKLEIHREEIAATTNVCSELTQNSEMSDEDEADSDCIEDLSWRNKHFL